MKFNPEILPSVQVVPPYLAEYIPEMSWASHRREWLRILCLLKFRIAGVCAKSGKVTQQGKWARVRLVKPLSQGNYSGFVLQSIFCLSPLQKALFKKEIPSFLT